MCKTQLVVEVHLHQVVWVTSLTPNNRLFLSLSSHSLHCLHLHHHLYNVLVLVYLEVADTVVIQVHRDRLILPVCFIFNARAYRSS